MRKIKSIVSLLLCLLAIFCFCSCGGEGKADTVFIRKKDASITVSADVQNKELYYCNKGVKKLQKVCQNGMLEMYFDKDTYSICVYDHSTGKLWRGLPEKFGKERAALILADVLIDGNRYTLDSQSDSVAFSSALYEASEDFVKVDYSFKRTLEDSTKISINIPVVYSLKQGVLSVEIDCANIIGEDMDKDVILESISILPYFGSNQKGGSGDFIFVPDGSGAVIDLSKNPKKFDDISLSVYGGDSAALNSGSVPALLGTFGMKSTAAFVGVIEKGEEIAEINAQKALEKGGFNQVFAKFKITPTSETEKGVYASNFYYQDKIKISYRFLSKEADYITMAGVCREMLIRNGMLSGVGAKAHQDYGFNLCVDFTEDEKVVTDISQCSEILLSLKAKGVGRINLVAEGLVSVSDSKVAFSSKLGSQTQYAQLVNGIKVDGGRMFADVALYNSFGKDTALNITGSAIQDVSSAEALEKNANSLMYALKDSDFDSVYINDAGESIYSDFSIKTKSLSTQRKTVVSQLLGALSSFKDVMVNGGNLYSLKYADTVIELPSKASIDGKALCSSVPFIQAVLHGEIQYSQEAINLQKDTVKAMLKTIEYGAIPYYRWHYADLSDEKNQDSSYYMYSINQAQLLYKNAKAILSDLQGSRITAHEKIKKSLYMTQYDDSTKIYVNYGKEAVTVDGVTVDAKSFLRVN